MGLKTASEASFAFAADLRLGIGEVTAYGAAWRSGSPWLCHPDAIPIDYVTRAGFLWRAGECYRAIFTID